MFSNLGRRHFDLNVKIGGPTWSPHWEHNHCLTMNSQEAYSSVSFGTPNPSALTSDPGVPKKNAVVPSSIVAVRWLFDSSIVDSEYRPRNSLTERQGLGPPDEFPGHPLRPISVIGYTTDWHRGAPIRHA